MGIEIASGQQLEAWLEEKPREWSHVIAVRAALRALPLTCDPVEFTDRTVDPYLPLVVFRVSAISSGAAKIPPDGIGLAAALAAAHNAAFAAARAADLTPAANAAVRAVTHAADAAYAYAADVDVHYAADAGFATDAAYAAADAAALTDFWQVVEGDCQALEGDSEPEKLLLLHLWPYAPEWWCTSWDAARRWLSRPEYGFEIWREWYYGRLEGLPHVFAGFSDEADRRFYGQILEYDDGWWSRDPAEVNADIKALVESLRKPKDAVDFFISYASEDEATARAVAAVLDDLGHSCIVQYRDFAQGNWINQMDAAMERAERLIPLYSQHYVGSDHCKTEWNHFYNLDPSAAERRIVAFRLDHADLKPMMDQIVYKDLTTVPRAEREQAMRDWIAWEPLPVTRENVAKTVTTHLDPGVIENEKGQLDTTPDPDLNTPEIPAELARAMDELRMMLNLVRQSERNLSRMMQHSLKLYDDHFTERGKDSSWGGLDRYIAVLTDGMLSMSSGELREEKAALEQLIAAHGKCMAALRNVEGQLRELANIPLEKADQAAIDDLIDKLAEVTGKARELGATTQEYDQHAQNLIDQGRDFTFEAGAPDADAKPDNARKRFLRYVGGFAIATVTLLGSLASIRSAPETQQLLAAGERLVQAFFRMVGL